MIHVKGNVNQKTLTYKDRRWAGAQTCLHSFRSSTINIRLHYVGYLRAKSDSRYQNTSLCVGFIFVSEEIERLAQS